MSDEEELNRFVHTALESGAERREISVALAEAGWQAADIEDALAKWSEVPFTIPVPSSRRSHSPYEAFLYFLLYLSLVLTLFFAGAAVFEVIDLVFPGITAGDPDDLRWPLSMVIVNLPVFLVAHRILQRRFRRNPALSASPTRRWFTYLTLALAASFLVGDLATLIFNLLGGDLTLRFLLKVATVGVLAGGAFLYYLREMRAVESPQ